MVKSYTKALDLFDDYDHHKLAAIYQGFGGAEAYPILEEKAANLLYFIVKNHSFSDGNKRIAAALFLLFLNKNSQILKMVRMVVQNYSK